MSKQFASVAFVSAAVLALTLAACSGGTTSGVDASLGGLAISAGSLNPAFASGTTAYSDLLPSGTSGLTVTPTASDANAKSITVAQDSGAAVVVESGQASPALAVPAPGARSVITIVVTGSDGKTTETYTVDLVQAGNGDATLSSLLVSAGTLNPAFASGTTSYAVTVPNGTSSFQITPTASDSNVASITVTQDNGAAKSVTSGSASAALTVPPAGGQSTITTTVTAQNGYTAISYVITLEQAGNGDASLTSLVASTGTLTPTFASGTTNYQWTVPNGTTNVTLTPTASNANVRSIQLIQDGGGPAIIASGTASALLRVPAPGGNSTIAITIESQDGATIETYNVSLTQAAGTQTGTDAGTDATLSTLTISAGALSPAFASATHSYNDVLPIGSSSSFTVTPAAHDPAVRLIAVSQDGGAAITVASGSVSTLLTAPVFGTISTIMVLVIAQDGVTTSAYTISVTLAGSTDSSLDALAVNSGSLQPAFTSGTTAYAVTVPGGNTGFTLRPSAHSALAKSITIAQDGGAASAIASGATSSSYTIPAAGTATVFSIVVTAQSGGTTTYVITVKRADPSDATLSSLVLSAGFMTPLFNPTTLYYTCGVPFVLPTLTVTPTASSPFVQSIVVTQSDGSTERVASGNAAPLMPPITNGATPVLIGVTSEDGTTKVTYTLAINRPVAIGNELSNLTASVGTLSPAFSTSNGAYTLTVPSGTTSFTLTPTSDMDTSSITVQQDAGAPVTVASGAASSALMVPAFGSTSTITIVVTSQNQDSSASYTIVVSEA